MKKVFVLKDLDCANCAAKIENALNKLEGVICASVSFMSGKMVLEVDNENFDAVLSEAEKLIKKVDSDVTIMK